MINQNQESRLKIFSTLKVLYTGWSTNEAISLLLSWIIYRVSEMKEFYTINEGKYWKLKISKQESDQFKLWKWYMQCVPQNKQYYWFFRGTVRISWLNKSVFLHAVWVFQCQSKIKKQENIFYFKNTIYRMLHENNNIAASLREHQEFPEKMIFTWVIWVNSGKWK